MLIQFKYILIDYKHQAFLQCSSVLGGLYSELLSCSIVVQRFWVKARVGTLKFRGDRHQQLNVWLIGAFYTLFYCTTVSDKSWEVKEKRCGCSKTWHSRAKDCQQQPNVLVKPPLALSTSIYFVTLVILLLAAQGNSAVKSQEFLWKESACPRIRRGWGLTCSLTQTLSGVQLVVWEPRRGRQQWQI